MSNSIDDSINPVKGSDYIRSVEALPEGDLVEAGVDSGLSSIEKSKTAATTAVPPMNVPILSAPADQTAFAVTTVDATGKSIVNVLSTFHWSMEEIKQNQLKGWAQNLEEIRNLIIQQLTSPYFLELQKIRIQGDSRLGGIQGVGTAGAKSRSNAEIENPGALISTIDRMRVMVKVPPTAEVQDTTPPQEPSRQLILPLFAVMAMGALGVVQATTSGAGVSSNVLTDVVKLVERLQPIMPQLSVANIIPALNLMIVGPIYINSWKQAASSFNNKEQQGTRETVHQFAQDVIKMVSDPTSVLTMLATQTAGKPLTQEDLDRRTTMLKLVMTGAALSLLYSLEVGKIHKGQFGGIQPEELRDILLGKIPVNEDPKRKPTMQQQLTASLLKRAWEQINLLPTEADREYVVNVMLSYLNEAREVNHLLDPAKVFQETFASATFEVKGQQPDRLKG